MADSRINLLTLSTSTASDDFFVTDGSANGTRRLSAFNPTIGGSLTVSAMISAGNQISTTAGLVCQNADVTGGYMTLRGFGNQDTGVVFLGQTANNNYISSNATTIGVTIGNVGITQTVAAGFRVSSTTNSTNTSSGALIVGNGSSGGLGVGGDTFIGGSLTVTGALNGIICNGAGLSLNTAGSASVRFQDTGVSKWWIYKLTADNNLYFRDMANSRMHMTFIPNLSSSTAISYLFSNLIVESAATSTSTATGALVVSGGIGAAGAINAGGTITSINSSGSGLLGMRSSAGNASYIFWSETGIADRGILGFNNGSSTLSYRSFSSSFATGTEVFSITSGGNVTAAGTLTVNGTSAVIRSLFTSTRQLEVQIPHTVSTENYLRVASNNGTTYGGDFGYGLTAAGDPEIRFNAVHAGAVTNWLTVRTTTALPSFPKAVSITDTTASTTTASGALVVTGGVGVGGNAVVGGSSITTGDGSGGPYIASSSVIDHSSGQARFYGRGSNTSTRATLGFYSTYSDGTGGITLQTFDVSGNATFGSSIRTSAPAGGTSAAWKLGTVATVTPTSPNRTIEVDIGGTTYYIHAKTTNN